MYPLLLRWLVGAVMAVMVVVAPAALVAVVRKCRSEYDFEKI